jgi:predicted alpha/beta-fold hydrolase
MTTAQASWKAAAVPITPGPVAPGLVTPASHPPDAAWLSNFEPIPFLRGSHAQTLAGNYWPRAPFNLPSVAEAVEVDPSDGSRVLCHCHWQPEPARAQCLTVLLVHGLEGSSDSQYIRGITARAWAAGCNVIRMNMRNCGGTDSWTPTLYHSGHSDDLGAVLHHFARKFKLQRMAMVGYSMGGNLVLKLAGDLGSQAPSWLLAAVGVCPAADLAATADALHQRFNRLYESHFLRNLMRRYHRKAGLFPEIYSTQVGPVRSVREFDERITAPYNAFAGADDYYFRASAGRVVAHIAIPTLVLHALDDPFVRITPETRTKLLENPSVRLIETKHGGHCAFLADTSKQATPKNGAVLDRHWAEATLVQFLLAVSNHHTRQVGTGQDNTGQVSGS